jgi:hypothetical protein
MDPALPETAPSPKPQTPDVVIQLSQDAGIIGEVKLSASSERDFDRARRQVARYDTDFIGWCTPDGRIARHDLFLLISYTHAIAGEHHFDPDAYNRPCALLTVTRDDHAHRSYSFEKRRGAFSDQRVQRKFSAVIPVGTEKLTPLVGRYKFYDARPACVEYTMDVLWRHYVSQVRHPEDQRNVTRNGRPVAQRRVELASARHYLQQAYGLVADGLSPEQQNRQPEVPQQSWIKEAMEAFVGIGRAERDRAEDGVYWANYSSRARNADLEGFARQVYRARQKKGRVARGSRKRAQPAQPTLFD